MRKRIKYVLIGTTAAAVVAAGTLTANAAWVIGGSAKVKTQTAKMPKGTKPSVESQSKAAVVSWSAQELVPGVKMDRYTVTAHSQDAPPKAAIVREVEASGAVSETVTFAAAEIAGGEWKWAVVPHYAKWVGAESRLSRALTFPTAAVAKVAGTPAAKTVVPTTPPTAAPAPVTKTSKKPAAEPVTTTPAPPPPEKTEDDTAPPPASSPAEAKPATTAAEPPTGGSADEGIPE